MTEIYDFRFSSIMNIYPLIAILLLLFYQTYII